MFNIEKGYDGFDNFTIGAIPDEYQDVSGVTATADGTLSGTSFVSKNGDTVQGEMPNNGDVSDTFDGIDVKSVTVPQGYTSGGVIGLTNDIDNEVVIQAEILAQIIAELEGKAGGGSSGTYETWVFTLDDGSVIEKQVEVSA